MAISTAQKKKKKDEEPGFDKDFWMVTFGDLLSLLLTFFVLLFAMSTLDDKMLKEMFTPFSGGAGVLSLSDMFPVEKPVNEKVAMARQMGLKEFMDMMNKERMKKGGAMVIDTKGLIEGLVLADVTIRKRGPSFVFSFPSGKMFARGSAALNPDNLPALKRLGDILRFSDSDLVIEGHTDDIPISTPAFPSNWELSAARAANVMRYLAENTTIKVERLYSAGFADTRPVVRNLSESYRARNRRVDIVVRQAPEI